MIDHILLENLGPYGSECIVTSTTKHGFAKILLQRGLIKAPVL